MDYAWIKMKMYRLHSQECWYILPSSSCTHHLAGLVGKTKWYIWIVQGEALSCTVYGTHGMPFSHWSHSPFFLASPLPLSWNNLNSNCQRAVSFSPPVPDPCLHLWNGNSSVYLWSFPLWKFKNSKEKTMVVPFLLFT